MTKRDDLQPNNLPISNVGKPYKSRAQALLFYGGREQTYRQWAAELGVELSTFIKRMRDHELGRITLERAMRPHNRFMTHPRTGNEIGKATPGARTRAVEALFEGFNKYGVPKLDKEVREYMKTGVKGPALKFFLEFQAFFPKDKNTHLDGESSSKQAQVAVVFNDNQQPTDFEIIE